MLAQGQGAGAWRRMAFGGLLRSEGEGGRGVRSYSLLTQPTPSKTSPVSLPHSHSAVPSAVSLIHSISARHGGYSPLAPQATCRALNTDSRKTNETKPLPRLFYVQNPMIWAHNKLDFRFLKKNWDPHFSESEFQRGCKQAIATITQLISKNMFDALKPLLTRHAMLTLRREVEVLWADEVRRNIALQPEEVQLIIPRKVHFRSLGDKKLCDIDMVFIGLKWIDIFDINPQLLFIDIIARFHRNYSEDVLIPEWTVSAFRVRRFNVLPSGKTAQTK